MADTVDTELIRLNNLVKAYEAVEKGRFKYCTLTLPDTAFIQIRDYLVTDILKEDALQFVKKLNTAIEPILQEQLKYYQKLIEEETQRLARRYA